MPWRVRSCQRRHRPRLFEIKVIKCRDVDFQMAKKEILGYYKSRGEACPDEAASDLELDCHEIGDALHASKIYAEARKIDGPQVIVKTGRHKAQSITMVENAKAIIIMKMGTSRSALHNTTSKKKFWNSISLIISPTHFGHILTRIIPGIFVINAEPELSPLGSSESGIAANENRQAFGADSCN